MQKAILAILLLLVALLFFGCTEKNYVNLGKMDSKLDLGNPLSMGGGIKIDSVLGNHDFVFPSAKVATINQNLNLIFPDSNFGKEWRMIPTNGGSLACAKGVLTGENANYYYCQASFARRIISSEGVIGPQETMQMKFYLDSRKIESDGTAPSEAFGIVDSNYSAIDK